MNGAFGAGIFPVTMALVGESFEKAIGKVMGMMFVGGAIGTSVNGRIINASSIGTIFLIAAVAMFLVAFLASTIVKKINTQAN